LNLFGYFFKKQVELSTADKERTTEEEYGKSPISENLPEKYTWDNTANDLEYDVYSTDTDDNIDEDWERTEESSESETDGTDDDEKRKEKELK
jgi:hypothetical protein